MDEYLEELVIWRPPLLPEIDDLGRRRMRPGRGVTIPAGWVVVGGTVRDGLILARRVRP